MNKTKYDLLISLSEAQNHKCICGITMLIPTDQGFFVTGPCSRLVHNSCAAIAVKYNVALPREEENLFAACFKCNSKIGNQRSVLMNTPTWKSAKSQAVSLGEMIAKKSIEVVGVEPLPLTARGRMVIALSEAQNHHCAYCEETMVLPIEVGYYLSRKKGSKFVKSINNRAATLDHVKPVCMGGTWAKANLVAACAKCNVKKSNHDAYEFFEERQAEIHRLEYNGPLFKRNNRYHRKESMVIAALASMTGKQELPTVSTRKKLFILWKRVYGKAKKVMIKAFYRNNDMLGANSFQI